MVRAVAIVMVGLASVGAMHASSLADAEALIAEERLPEAEAMLEKLAALQPNDLQVRFRYGYVQFRLRKLAAAEQSFVQVVKAAPPALEARYFLGRIAMLQERSAEAIRWLLPVVKARDTTYDAASQLAAAYVKAGQLQSAVQPLQEAIRREPWDGSLYYRLSRLHGSLGQPELAREALAVSAKLRAANRATVEALMTAGTAFRSGRLTDAIGELQRIANEPNPEPNVLMAAGLLYTEMQQAALAAATFERAATVAPTLFAAQFNHGLALLRGGQAAAALPVLEKAVALLPQSAEAQRTLGLAAVMTGDYERAISPLEEAHTLEPKDERIATLLGTAYLRTEKTAKAVALLQPLARTAQDPAAGLTLTEALQKAGRQEDALAAAREVHRRFPEDMRATMALAQSLTIAGRFAEARPLFAAVVATRDAPPEAILGLADASQKAGEHAAAVDFYRRALAYRAVTLHARLGLARSLISLRQFEEARRVLEEGELEHGSEPALYVELARLYTRLRQPDLAARATRRVEELKAPATP
jgi:tetratricopeptide (TPR) repeat protein